jgi:hypothetical protein
MSAEQALGGDVGGSPPELAAPGPPLPAALPPPTVRLGATPDRRTVLFTLNMPSGTFTW